MTEKRDFTTVNVLSSTELFSLWRFLLFLIPDHWQPAVCYKGFYCERISVLFYLFSSSGLFLLLRLSVFLCSSSCPVFTWTEPNRTRREPEDPPEPNLTWNSSSSNSDPIWKNLETDCSWGGGAPSVCVCVQLIQVQFYDQISCFQFNIRFMI